MSSQQSDEALLTTIEKMGFAREEALIYLTLVRYGKTGAIVKDLVHKTSIGRTTIYAILDRLMDKGGVVKGGASNTAKRAQLFVASEPTGFLSSIFKQKKQALHELEEQYLLHHDYIQRLYHQGIEFTFDTLDPFIQPYLKTVMLEKGWTVTSYIVEKFMQTFGCDVFSCELRIPGPNLGEGNSRNIAYFIVYVFDYEIETNETSQRFFIDLARRKTQHNIRVKGQFQDVQLEDGEITLLGRTWSSFTAKAKISDQYIDIGQIPIVPIKHKLFFLSAGTLQSLKELAQAIYAVEDLLIG